MGVQYPPVARFDPQRDPECALSGFNGLLPPAFVALLGNLLRLSAGSHGVELCLTGCYAEAFEVERSR